MYHLGPIFCGIVYVKIGAIPLPEKAYHGKPEEEKYQNCKINTLRSKLKNVGCLSRRFFLMSPTRYKTPSRPIPPRLNRQSSRLPVTKNVLRFTAECKRRRKVKRKLTNCGINGRLDNSVELGRPKLRWMTVNRLWAHDRHNPSFTVIFRFCTRSHTDRVHGYASRARGPGASFDLHPFICPCV